MLPAVIQEKLTPKRKRQGLYVLLAALLYSLLGFLAMPFLVEKLLKDFVAEKLKLEASVSKVQLNPWALSARLNDLKVAEPKGGETLIAAKSIYVNLDALSSIWIRGAALDDLDLQDLYVNARLDKSGQLNLMKLVPPSDPKAKSSGSVSWKVSRFGLHQAHIDFRDDTRPTPFTAVFSPLNIGLETLSSQPNKNGEYQLAAETGHGEKLRWHGTLALQPLRSAGHLEVDNLQATTPWSYVQDSVPVIVKTGAIGVAGDYRLKLDQAVDFKLDQGHVTVNKLSFVQKAAKEPLVFALDKLDLSGLQLDWPLHAVNAQALTLGGFSIGDATVKQPLVGFQTLGLQQIGWQAGEQVGSLKRIELDQLALRDAKEQSLLNVPSLVLDALQAKVPEQSLRVDRITLNGGDADVRVLPGNQVNVLQALDGLTRRLQAMAPPAGKEEKPAGPPWAVALGEVDLNKFQVNAQDERFRPAVKIPVQDITMRIQPRPAPDQPHVVDGSFGLGFGGKVAINGSFSESPVDTDVKINVHELNIPPLAPYFADIGRFELKSGNLDVDGRFKFHQGKQAQASFDGRVAVNRFAANDLDMDQRFMAWKQLAADGIKWNLSPMSVSVKQVTADEPYTRLIITPDYKLNLQHIFAEAKTNTVDQKPITKSNDNAPLMPVKVDRVLVKNGSMLFADFTLKPQFATGIQALSGDIQGVSTNKAARAKVNLSGRVDQYGAALITGELSPLATDQYSDVHFKFDNVELTTMTPYSAKFAGYRIDQGKLSLDLNYKINNRQLQATNKVVVNQLKLGDKVDSPDAVNLPLRLAVAILKDSNGVIDIDLPVSGSMDDPKFRVGPIVWKAFVNLLTKAATAPFKFIAGLVGGGDDMDSIAFEPGTAIVKPDQTDKLKKVAQAVQQRPSLHLELRGAYDKQADLLALRTVKFNAEFQKRQAEGGKDRKLLEAMFKEKVGKEALEEQKALSLKPPADNAADPKAALALSEQAYLTSLRNELIAREIVTDGELRQLALDRASAMRSQLVEQDKLNAAQIFVLEPEAVTAVNNQVVCKLGLNAG